MSQLKLEAATRATGLLVKFQHCNTYVALTLAEDILGQLETLNSSLQSKITMSGLKAANNEMVKSLYRYQANFRQLKRAEFDLDDIQVLAKKSIHGEETIVNFPVTDDEKL